jgi:hypothetical protein
MATLAHGLTEAPPAEGWLWDFLRHEIAPYPGRMATVGRMVLASTLVMFISETYRMPSPFQGAVFTLLVSRESPQATARSAGTTILVTFIAVAYLLIGAWFVISFPWLHFLWNISSFFLAFYMIATLTNYGAAVVFAFIIAAGIPLWGTQVPAEENVELTLWLLSGLIGVAVALAVELPPSARPFGNHLEQKLRADFSRHSRSPAVSRRQRHSIVWLKPPAGLRVSLRPYLDGSLGDAAVTLEVHLAAVCPHPPTPSAVRTVSINQLRSHDPAVWHWLGGLGAGSLGLNFRRIGPDRTTKHRQLRQAARKCGNDGHRQIGGDDRHRHLAAPRRFGRGCPISGGQAQAGARRQHNDSDAVSSS